MSGELIRVPEPMMPAGSAQPARRLTDGFGRSFPYLRLSLTEACNFRCSYCLPDGYQADGRPRLVQVDEIARPVRVFAALGMSKIRLTGGEPSLRKDLDEIIVTVAAVPGIRKVAITTNGTLLPRRSPKARRSLMAGAKLTVWPHIQTYD